MTAVASGMNQLVDRQERLDLLVAVAKRYAFDLFFAIKPDGRVGYYWKQRPLRVRRLSGVFPEREL